MFQKLSSGTETQEQASQQRSCAVTHMPSTSTKSLSKFQCGEMLATAGKSPVYFSQAALATVLPTSREN